MSRLKQKNYSRISMLTEMETALFNKQKHLNDWKCGHSKSQTGSQTDATKPLWQTKGFSAVPKMAVRATPAEIDFHFHLRTPWRQRIYEFFSWIVNNKKLFGIHHVLICPGASIKNMDHNSLRAADQLATQIKQSHFLSKFVVERQKYGRLSPSNNKPGSKYEVAHD